MQVAILAGGLATRLGGLTRNQPKSMIIIRGKPFLEYQLELLREAGVRSIVLCVGHLAEQIKKHFGDGRGYGVDLIYSVEDKPLGTGGALKNAEDLLDETFFTMYGDSYLSLDFGSIMSYFKSQDKLGLMTVYRNYDSYDRSNTAIEGNLVRKYSKNDKNRDMFYIDYGVSIFRKDALELIPEKRPYPLEDFFATLIDKNELLAFEVKERFYEIGSLEGLRDFENYVAKSVK